MFNCRVCANTPFGAIFGYEDDSSRSRDKRSRRHKGHEIRSMMSREDSQGSEPAFHRATSAERTCFRRRYPDEVHTKVAAWFSYLHVRAHEFWKDEATIKDALEKVASSVDREADPILAELGHCVFWHGDVSPEDGTPTITMVKPGESSPADVSVTRILVFLYADDDSFEELQQRPQQVLKTICDEPLCINLSHISLD